MGGLLSRFIGNRDPLSGRVFLIHRRPYEFLDRLGSGGFGAVYSALGPQGSYVAVKVINLKGLPPSRILSLVESYLNEVDLLNRLRQASTHVVYIHDFDFDPMSGRAFIVMELGAENLSTLIDRLRGLNFDGAPSIDPEMLRAFWRQMVDIVTVLHAHSIVHMDLKPANLILFGTTLKIADLGISRRVHAPGRSRMGTPFFSAPEVMQDFAGLQRYYGPQVDIWSLGAILYYMVYGTPPTYHSFAADPPPGVMRYPDRSLNSILRLTLALDPHRRADINTLRYHRFTRS